jgi:hypothetical protein
MAANTFLIPEIAVLSAHHLLTVRTELQDVPREIDEPGFCFAATFRLGCRGARLPNQTYETVSSIYRKESSSDLLTECPSHNGKLFQYTKKRNSSFSQRQNWDGASRSVAPGSEDKEAHRSQITSVKQTTNCERSERDDCDVRSPFSPVAPTNRGKHSQWVASACLAWPWTLRASDMGQGP